MKKRNGSTIDISKAGREAAAQRQLVAAMGGDNYGYGIAERVHDLLNPLDRGVAGKAAPAAGDGDGTLARVEQVRKLLAVAAGLRAVRFDAYRHARFYGYDPSADERVCLATRPMPLRTDVLRALAAAGLVAMVQRS